jgi:hypothetical protein
MAAKKGSRRKSGSRKYGKAAGKTVESAMRRKKRGKLRSAKVVKEEKSKVASRPLPSVYRKPARKALRFPGKNPDKMFQAPAGFGARA